MRRLALSNLWMRWNDAGRPRGLWVAMALAMTACWLGEGTARGQAPAKKAASEDKTLTTKDNVDIKITYFKSTGGPETPVVVMLHGQGGNRLVWKPYAEALQKADYAVITVDLRGHGESAGGAGTATTGKKAATVSLKPRDYAAMVAGDLEAVKKFIYEEHQKKQLNMNKLGLVAADMSTPIAIAYTEVDWLKTPYDDAPTPAQCTPRGQDVQALVLISPEASVPGVNIGKSITLLRELRRPVLIGVGSKVAADMAAANKMYDQIAPKKEEYVYLEKYDAKLSGTDLLGKNLKLESHLFNFLNKHVKDVKSEWRDRQSKLDK